MFSLENETVRNSDRFSRTSLAKGRSVEKPAVCVTFRHFDGGGAADRTIRTASIFGGLAARVLTTILER
jgi:hypothetical protein